MTEDEELEMFREFGRRLRADVMNSAKECGVSEEWVQRECFDKLKFRTFEPKARP